MKKERIAQGLTVLLMGAILGFFAYRKRGAAPREAEASAPESAVWRMVEASRDADPERYLESYTGEMERLLRRNSLEMGSPKFREYLSATYRQVKGIAVSAPQMISPSEGHMSVEYVYADHNETQQVYVRRMGREWKIFRVESAERIKTLIPYGTPATQ